MSFCRGARAGGRAALGSNGNYNVRHVASDHGALLDSSHRRLGRNPLEIDMKNNYASALSASERVAWKLDDVFNQDAVLDFSQPFLPETLVDSAPLTWLSATERRTLNQIRAHGYLSIFGLVEEFILPFVMQRLQARASAEMPERRALLGFAAEEAKHIELFQRFKTVFRKGFGHACDVMGPASDIQAHVLAHSELSVGLLVLHIEWMTQWHYVEMVRDDGELEPNFRRLLHEHWKEESQHARIDGFIVEALAEAATEQERERAFREYLSLLAFLDAGLKQQVVFDRSAFERATRRALSDAEAAQFMRVQQQAQRRTYLGSGVNHPQLRATVERIYPQGARALRESSELYG